MKFMCVSRTVPFLHLSLEGQENSVPSWLDSFRRERERLEPSRRSDVSRNNFQEHLKIMGAISPTETKDGGQIALRTKIYINHLG